MAKKEIDSNQKTLNLINEVKKQREEIAKLEKPNWLTNCYFSYIEGRLEGAVNIHVEANIGKLVKIAAFLIEKERFFHEAKVRLGIESIDFSWEDFPLKYWLQDIELRINKIQIATKKNKLDVLEARLNSCMTPELKAKMELEAIESELSK